MMETSNRQGGENDKILTEVPIFEQRFENEGHSCL